jgi:hypothetical protein
MGPRTGSSGASFAYLSYGFVAGCFRSVGDEPRFVASHPAVNHAWAG